MPSSVRQLLVAIAAVAALAAPAAAQNVTANEIQQLEESVRQIERDLFQMQQTDRLAARGLSAELATIEEEVIYLKVKQRREGRVTRAEYTDVRSQLDALGNRVSTGQAGGIYTGPPATDVPVSQLGTLPTGTQLDVRLQSALDSGTAQVEDRFEATTTVDLRQNGHVIVPAGSTVRGVITAVREPGRLDRTASLTLSFDQITIHGRNYPIRATVTDAIEGGGYREDAERIGAGAAVGGILGGIIGGVRGALAGILIGGGGVIAATEGRNVELPPGTVLRMRLDQPLTVTGTFTR